MDWYYILNSILKCVWYILVAIMLSNQKCTLIASNGSQQKSSRAHIVVACSHNHHQSKNTKHQAAANIKSGGGNNARWRRRLAFGRICECERHSPATLFPRNPYTSMNMPCSNWSPLHVLSIIYVFLHTNATFRFNYSTHTSTCSQQTNATCPPVYGLRCTQTTHTHTPYRILVRCQTQRTAWAVLVLGTHTHRSPSRSLHFVYTFTIACTHT